MIGKIMSRYIYIAILAIGILPFTYYSSIAGNNSSGIISSNNRDINVISSIDPQFDVALGNVDGYMSEHKFGRNIEIDDTIVADIWDGGHTLASGGVSLIWVAPTQARIHAIVSSSASDDGDPVGVGARTIRIWGLTDWVSGEISEIITLNGTGAINTVNSYVMINRMTVLTKGGTNVNVGVIKATAATDSTITSQIRVGQGRTHQAIYGFPSTQDMYIDRIHADQMKTGGSSGLADMDFLYNPEPQTELTNFVSQHPFGLLSTGISALSVVFKHPKKLLGPGLVKMQCLSGAANMDISAGFDFVLVDTNTDYLLGGGASNGVKLQDSHGRYLLRSGN